MAEGQIEQWVKKQGGAVVEAVRLNEDNVEAIAAWSQGDLVEEIDPEHPDEMQYGINLMTPDGMRRASLHMYVIRYGNQFFTTYNRRFEELYMPVGREETPLESAGDARRQRGFSDPFDTGRFGV